VSGFFVATEATSVRHLVDSIRQHARPRCGAGWVPRRSSRGSLPAFGGAAKGTCRCRRSTSGRRWRLRLWGYECRRVGDRNPAAICATWKNRPMCAEPNRPCSGGSSSAAPSG